MASNLRSLRFDGSHIGEHEFWDVVKWYRPVYGHGTKSPVIMALLHVDSHVYPVFLKKDQHGFIDQVIVDELKQPLVLLRWELIK